MYFGVESFLRPDDQIFCKMAASPVKTDVLIVGSGPAGLSAALGLARHLHHVIVFDNDQPRNYPAKYMHNVLTWDHRNPAEFRSSARANILDRYETIQFRDSTVHTLSKNEHDEFEAVDSAGVKYAAKKVVLASGRQDDLPAIPGYEECWGEVIVHCLFCHGFEERGGPSAGVLAVGLLSNPQGLVNVVRMASQLAEQVRIYTNGNEAVKSNLQQHFTAKSVVFDARKIESFVKLATGGLEVHLEGGGANMEAFVTHFPPNHLKGDLHRQLNLEMDNQIGQEVVKTKNMFNETSVPGCFAVGEIMTGMASVTLAMVSGGSCAVNISPQLVQLQ